MNTLCKTFCKHSCPIHSTLTQNTESKMELEEDQPMSQYDYQEEVEEAEAEAEAAESNLEELHRLYSEATQLLINNTPPSEGWYDSHFQYIYKYSELNWRDLAERFRYKDNIVFTLATTINLYIEELMEEYGGKPDFDFNKYYTVLCNIINIWNYYSEKYIGGETDQDILDLIEGITGL